jgi:two-component system chemotaxis response regulator CheB
VTELVATKSADTGMKVGDPYRVLVCDDSAVIRGLIGNILRAEPLIDVVETASNGQRALDALDRHDIEIIVLDIEMPIMDGLTALPKLLEKKPDLKIIIASTLSERNAEVSLKAMASGAADYVPKPTTGKIGRSVDFQKELLEKIKIYGRACRREKGIARPRNRLATNAKSTPESPARDRSRKSDEITLRPTSKVKPQVLAIGSSTGGPQALFEIFTQLRNSIRFPILITQHMPPTFTKILAERLTKITGMNAAEAVDREPVVGDRIYVAPGDFHMTVVRGAASGYIKLSQAPPENFCRPAVDPMLRSLSEVYGNRVFSAILTGMGHDGCEGARRVVDTGGTVVGQDKATSVVWGMPGTVATAGLCSAVLPLRDVAPYIRRTFGAN